MNKYLLIIVMILTIPLTLSSMKEDFGDFDDTLFVDIVQSNLGDTIQVDFVVYSWDEINAIQWTIDYNPKMELSKVESPFKFPSAHSDFGGYATFSWINALTPLFLSDGEILFTMKFVSNGEQEANVAFSNTPTSIEIFNAKGELVLLVPSSLSLDNATILSAIIYDDENSNCIYDEDENPIPNLLLSLNGQTLKTDEDGRISRFLKPGDYTINTQPNTLWSLCADQTMFTIDEETGPLKEISVAAQPKVECASASISAATSFLRRCVDNKYFFEYCNIGTQDIVAPEINISFAEEFIFKESSITPVSVAPQDITLIGADMNVGECKTFSMVFEPVCDSTALGETYCIQAIISPAETCIESAAWTGADVQVEAACENNEVTFSIKNVGDGNMGAPLSFIVIEDDVMMPFPDDEDDYDIDSGDSVKVTIPANGRTYRIVAEQEPNHPFPGSPTIAIERCGESEDGEVSLGFVNQFEEGDQSPSEDIFCAEIIGSFDPNDKQGFPRGYGEDQMIYSETQMEYLIRFQNTGNDTAFNVFIEDSLRKEFDLSTIQVGPASHRFTWEIKNERTLVFKFDDILLPDSTTNERESHGFIKYKVQQSSGNTDGTYLENHASIFFDFNEPIITNTTSHLIGSDFIISSIVSLLPTAQNPFSIYPNPTDSGLWIEQLNEKEEAVFTVFSYEGRIIFSKPINHQLNFIDRRNLSEGLHFYTITTAEGSTYSGKITVLR